MTEFLPIPEINRVYQTKENNLIIVKELLGTSDDRVAIVEEYVSGNQFKWTVSEWNENIDHVISEAISLKCYDKAFKSKKQFLQMELESIQLTREEGKKIKGKFGWYRELLWFIAGADKDLLRMYQADHARMATLGCNILWKGILIGLSMGYGAHLLTDSMIVPIVVGLLCFGLFVSLDRFLIITTMYYDGEPSISMREFKSSLPRIIIGLIIGIIVAIPMQLKVFEGMINEYILEEHYNTIVTSQAYDLNEKHICDLKAEIESLRSDIAINEKLYYEDVQTGKNGFGVGPKAKMLSIYIDETKKLLIEKSNELSRLESKRDSLISEAYHPYDANFSLISKVEALHKITSLNNGIVVFFLNLLIVFLFVLISITPVLQLMMATSGVYEGMVLREAMLMQKLIEMDKIV